MLRQLSLLVILALALVACSGSSTIGDPSTSTSLEIPRPVAPTTPLSTSPASATPPNEANSPGEVLTVDGRLVATGVGIVREDIRAVCLITLEQRRSDGAVATSSNEADCASTPTVTRIELYYTWEGPEEPHENSACANVVASFLDADITVSIDPADLDEVLPVWEIADASTTIGELNGGSSFTFNGVTNIQCAFSFSDPTTYTRFSLPVVDSEYSETSEVAIPDSLPGFTPAVSATSGKPAWRVELPAPRELFLSAIRPACRTKVPLNDDGAYTYEFAEMAWNDCSGEQAFKLNSSDPDVLAAFDPYWGGDLMCAAALEAMTSDEYSVLSDEEDLDSSFLDFELVGPDNTLLAEVSSSAFVAIRNSSIDVECLFEEAFFADDPLPLLSDLYTP